jgi:hypothetical protein
LSHWEDVVKFLFIVVDIVRVGRAEVERRRDKQKTNQNFQIGSTHFDARVG